MHINQLRSSSFLFKLFSGRKGDCNYEARWSPSRVGPLWCLWKQKAPVSSKNINGRLLNGTINWYNYNLLNYNVARSIKVWSMEKNCTRKQPPQKKCHNLFPYSFSVYMQTNLYYYDNTFFYLLLCDNIKWVHYAKLLYISQSSMSFSLHYNLRSHKALYMYCIMSWKCKLHKSFMNLMLPQCLFLPFLAFLFWNMFLGVNFLIIWWREEDFLWERYNN